MKNQHLELITDDHDAGAAGPPAARTSNAAATATRIHSPGPTWSNAIFFAMAAAPCPA